LLSCGWAAAVAASTLAAQESEKNAFAVNQQKRLDYNIDHILQLTISPLGTLRCSRLFHKYLRRIFKLAKGIPPREQKS
jgi:hypothetical protein